VHDELGVQALRGFVAEGNHFLELPAGVDVQQREGNATGEERLAREVQQHRGIFADGVHQQRLGELGRHLAHDVDALGFQPRQVRQAGGSRIAAGSRDGFQGCHWLYLGVHRDPSKQKYRPKAGVRATV
jgi:hypothetical protein